MAKSVIVDASFLVTLISRREANHRWALQQSERFPPPWKTCEAAISETFHLLGAHNAFSLVTLLRRHTVTCPFVLDDNAEPVIDLMQKYADVPMSFADACLVRMTELMPDPMLLTTDADFRVYRRLGRRVVPCAMPG